MGSIINQQKQIERKKRYLFLGVGTAGVLATIAVTPLIGIPIMAMGAFLGYKWFEFRAKNGMRF